MINVFSPLQLVWARITYNRVTTIYTLNALTYCIVMVLCQVSLWNMNVYAGDLGKAIMAQTNLSASKFVYLEAHSGVLRLCENNHDALTPDKSCAIVWDPQTSPFNNSTTIHFPTSSDPRPVDTDARNNKKKRYVEIEKTLDGQGRVNGVRVAGLHLDQFATGAAHQAQHLKDSVIADLTCVQAMKWPIQIVLQGKREDVLLTSFQIWVLGMSLMAVLNESIPHIFGAYIAHVLAIIWSAFQIWETANFKAEYLKATLNGPCAESGLDFLAQYFDPRTKFGIAMAVINFIALFSSGFLTYKLFHLFGWSTFKRIGASVSINRVYKLALTLSIIIQMSLFFIVSMMGLWIDQIYSGVFAPFSARSGLYKVVFIILFVLLVPWLALGWFAVRKEQRWWMHIFIIISVILLGAWGGIMFSTSFQLTFVHWRFFSTIWVIAFLLLLLTLVMGVVCRLNFGKGLAEYLQQQNEGLPEDEAEKFRPDSPAPSSLDEKDLVVSFPSDSSDLPQFLPSQAAPAPLVPSKKSFYSKWGRSKGSHETPPAPRGAPPAPPSNSSYDLERGPPSYLASSVVAVGSHGTPSYNSSSAYSSSLNSLAVLHDHEQPFTSTNSYRSTAQTLAHADSTSAVSQAGGVSIAHTLSLDNNSYSVGRDSSIAHTLSPPPGSLSRDGTVASSTMFSHHTPETYGSPPNGSALNSSGISHRDRDTTHSRMSGASGIIATAGLSRSDTSFTGFTAHRRKGSAGTIGSFNSALDPTMPAMAHAKAGGVSAMPSALMRTDTLRSVDSVKTMDTMDSGRTVGAAKGGKSVTRNTSTTSTASMKPGVKPKNWTIE